MPLTKKQAKKIKEYYANQIISERLKTITPTGRDKGETYANSVYENYHITQYANKAEYENAVEFQTRAIIVKTNQADIKKMRRERKDVKSYIDKLTQDRIDEGWRDYQHRDALIRSGQYEEFRILDYKDKYVTAMKQWGIDEKLIDKIDTATVEELDRLFVMRDAQKDTPNKYKLPVLGFYYGNLPATQRADVESNIWDAVNNAFITDKSTHSYDDDDYDFVEPVFTNEQTRVMDRYARHTYTMARKSVARTAARRLPARYRPYTTDYSELYNQMTYAYLNNDLKIRTTKRGYKYIPFVGSTNPKSKNAKFMRGLVEYAAAFGVEFDK